MYLPDSVLLCMHTLEQAGFDAYAVGGCVRDALLGKTPLDYDLCTNATPQQTAQLFESFPLVRSGEKHGTIGVVIDDQITEITTFRTEGNYQDGRHPEWVQFVAFLQEDLARRDFTINAMAYNPKCGYIDPFGGQQDLQNRVLRTVGNPRDRFSEDALRILRGVRFAVRYQLTPTSDTLQAMKELAPLMDQLARERVFDELCKLLPLVNAQDLLDYRDIFIQVIPALAPCVNFLQCSPHHRYDIYTHTAHTVASAPANLAVRWAALLHDCGKPACFQPDEAGIGHFHGHAQVSAQLAEETLFRLKAPTALREQICFLIDQHMTLQVPDKRLLRRRLGKCGESVFLNLLDLQQADAIGTGIERDLQSFTTIRTLVQEILAEDACLQVKDLQINGTDLQKAGFVPGPTLGKCLQWLLEQVQDELLPNEPEALTAAAKTFLKEI